MRCRPAVHKSFAAMVRDAPAALPMRAEFIENLIPRRPVTPSPRPSPLRGEGVCACGEDPTRRRVAAPPSPFGEAMIRYLTDRKIHATVLSVDRERRHGPQKAVQADYATDRWAVRKAVPQRGCLRRLPCRPSLARWRLLPA